MEGNGRGRVCGRQVSLPSGRVTTTFRTRNSLRLLDWQPLIYLYVQTAG